jgi:hypothetical protein
MEHKMKLSNEITYAQVWATLNSVDLSKFHEKKGNFTYLSWTDAWTILMEHYPFASYEFHNETYEENGTVMTHCTVRIGDLSRYMWLPVMDNRLVSIKNPTTREIQDSRMRCLVKCLAVFGLGMYIFKGQDLPDASKDAAEAEVKYRFRFVKTGGEIVGADTSKEYLDVIRPLLKTPSNVLHKKAFNANKEQIEEAQKCVAVEDTDIEARYAKLFELYTENENDSA